jgi:excisionase family DNA binding protein
MLNISRDTLFGLLRKREIRSMKVGRLRLIPAEAIDEYVARKMAEDDFGVE